MVAASLSLALSSCVTTRDEGEALKRDIATLKTEVAQAQSQGSDARARLEGMERRVVALEGTLAALRQADADGGVQMDKVVAEVQTLRGEIEQARHDLGETTASVKDILARPPLSVAAGGVSAPKIDDPGAAAMIGGLEVPVDAQGHYKLAKKLFDDKKFADSAEAFDLYLQRHGASAPDSVTNAAFWKAESYFGQASARGDAKSKEKALKQAILAYQRVIEDPKSEKNDAALLKIGMSFEQLGLKEEAKAFYKEVIDKHGKSPLAGDARKRLKSLGGPTKRKSR